MIKSALLLPFAALSFILAPAVYAQDDQLDREERRAKMREAAEARFAEIDTDGDGALSLQEREAMAASRFSEMDSDGDGAVTRAEMEAAAEARREERRGRRQGSAFDAMDANGDGVISAEEHQTAVVQRFERLDADGDGLITHEEMQERRRGLGRRGSRGQ